MKDYMELIKTRRSVRKYTNQQIPNEFLNSILESIKWSPSWANTQCWEIITVKEEENKKKLISTISVKNPAEKSLGMAPVTLIVCAKMESSGYYKNVSTTKYGDWFMYDIGIISQSISLTAWNFGIGSVIVGMFDHNKTKELFNIPNGFEAVSYITLGYPDHEPKTPKRREVDEFVHGEEF